MPRFDSGELGADSTGASEAESNNINSPGGAVSNKIDDDEGATAPPTSTRRLDFLREKTAGDPLSDGSADKARANRPGALSTEVVSFAFSSSPRDRKLEATRRRQRRRLLLAKEVEEGVRAAHQKDPDLQVKDADLRLLNVRDIHSQDSTGHP